MRPAVEFEKTKNMLVLVYRPQDEDQWVHDKFKRGEDLLIKGTYRFTKKELLPNKLSDPDDAGLEDDQPLRFKLGRLSDNYYIIDDHVLEIGVPVWLHRDCNINWKWFSAERRVSIFGVIAQLRPKRIVVGGDEPDAIPDPEFERLLKRFPTTHELHRYSLARVASVVREYTDTEVDAENAYQKYLGKVINTPADDITGRFRESEVQKFSLLQQRLKHMLNAEESYSEAKWQSEILQIIQLLNPRYIHALEKVRIRDLDSGTQRELDIMLIDASGNIDLIEIKKPFDKSIVSDGKYRNNHIPLRELSGAIMQIEKYIYYLNRWGAKGEEELTQRFSKQLPAGFKIKITNPVGIVIIGRDHNLTADQARDFEIVKRKYKSIADILTYDDLLRRIDFIIRQLTASGADASPIP